MRDDDNREDGLGDVLYSLGKVVEYKRIVCVTRIQKKGKNTVECQLKVCCITQSVCEC